MRPLTVGDPDGERFARAMRNVFQPWHEAHMSADGGATWTDAPAVLAGSVTFDKGADVYASGSATFAVPFDKCPDALMPWGGRVRFCAGIRYPNGDLALAELGTFVVWETAESGETAVVVKFSDASALLRDDRLESPRTFRAGSDALAVASTLVRDVIAGAAVVSARPLGRLAADLVVESDRLPALRTIGDGADVWGAFHGDEWRFRAEPTETTPAVVRLEPGTSLVSATRTVSRDGVRNVIVARGENTGDASPSIQSRAVDSDISSATFVGGPFGRSVEFYSSPLLTSNGAAAAAARTVLARRRVRSARVAVSATADPRIEPGDVVDVVTRGGVLRRVVSKCDVSLTVAAVTALDVGTVAETRGEP
jgi:hypothetical protein